MRVRSRRLGRRGVWGGVAGKGAGSFVKYLRLLLCGSDTPG